MTIACAAGSRRLAGRRHQTSRPGGACGSSRTATPRIGPRELERRQERDREAGGDERLRHRHVVAGAGERRARVAGRFAGLAAEDHGEVEVVLSRPGGFEAFVADVAALDDLSPATLAATAARHDIEILGPPAAMP